MKILVVEDQESLARSITRGLEQKGYAADYVTDGEKAVNRIIMHHSTYDLVILDLMLPKQSGLEVCRIVRERGIAIPILVLTAKSEEVDKVLLLSSGADDYLVKPFSFHELIARIQALLRRPQQALPTTLTVQDISLDTAMHKVFKGTEEVQLTTKEFALLELFMRNPNQALSREFILEHVWDFGFDSFSNVVDVHVKNLRKKFGDGSRESVFETVRGGR